MGAMIEAKAKVYSTMAHENERRRARSARRAKGHSKRPRNREKLKIVFIGDENGSSVTYYTSTTESDLDSIPEINEPET